MGISLGCLAKIDIKRHVLPTAPLRVGESEFETSPFPPRLQTLHSQGVIGKEKLKLEKKALAVVRANFRGEPANRS